MNSKFLSARRRNTRLQKVEQRALSDHGKQLIVARSRLLVVAVPRDYKGCITRLYIQSEFRCEPPPRPVTSVSTYSTGLGSLESPIENRRGFRVKVTRKEVRITLPPPGSSSPAAPPSCSVAPSRRTSRCRAGDLEGHHDGAFVCDQDLALTVRIRDLNRTFFGESIFIDHAEKKKKNMFRNGSRR